MPDDPAKPPRFPYVAALLCAACVGATVWTWMRYSYAWDAVPASFFEFDPAKCGPSYNPLPDNSMLGRYVRLRGKVTGVVLSDLDEVTHEGAATYVLLVGDPCYTTSVRVPASLQPSAPKGSEDVFLGRVVFGDRWAFPSPSAWPVLQAEINTAASRFTGASVASVVVGAMGVFVFTVASRHWLGERRRFRERDKRA